MLRFVSSVLLICASAVAITLPPLPTAKKIYKRSTTEIKGATKLIQQPKAIVAPTEKILPFKYPLDKTNYIWSLDSSVDLKHWTPDTNYIVLTNGDWKVQSTKVGSKFYRLHGVK